ncbi:hypothetical protein QBZ16_001342 [Prototheca wickerhamii]|uniref:LMBR1-like membrane protein n=1 Tax=Prototheca wickerhamii TaxID=3111 RepID=A0AAD9MLW4_PROWI|nr:hypothetical protein QBZ16_001342 [Prototheca wickerhamii]
MMLFFYAVALPMVVCLVLYGLIWLPSKSTGLAVRIDVGLAWGAALATLVLVPTDVATTLLGGYGFFATLLVLPVHMELTRRGKFTTLERLTGAIRYNLVYYCALLGLSAAGILALIVTRTLQVDNIVGIGIALSNAYGLIGAIFLMGYGLVAIPRQLWRSADLGAELQRCCHDLAATAERVALAQRRLSRTLGTVQRASALFGPRDPLRAQMEAVLELAARAGPLDELAGASATLYSASGDGEDSGEDEALDVFDAGDLAGLRRRLKTDLKDHERERALYGEAAARGLRLDALLAAASGASALAPGAPPDRAVARSRAAAHFWLHRGAAVAAGAASLATVLAESTMIGALPNLSAVSWALHAAAACGSSFGVAAACLLCLAYPCACANYSLYRLGRFAFYRTVPRHTDAYSLCYSALLVTRFASPLAFNFMAAIALPQGDARGVDVTDTVFYAQFGRLMMAQPLIGWRFASFAPAILLPYCLVVALGLFNPIARLLDRGRGLEFEDDWEGGGAARGKRLLRAEADAARARAARRLRPRALQGRPRRRALAMPSMAGRRRAAAGPEDAPAGSCAAGPALSARARLLAALHGEPERQSLLSTEQLSPASSLGSLSDVSRSASDLEASFDRLAGRGRPWRGPLGGSPGSQR